MAYIRASQGGGGYPSSETRIYQNYNSTQPAGLLYLDEPITNFKLIKFLYAANHGEAQMELVVESDTLLATASPNADGAYPRIGIGYERGSLQYMRLINLVPNTSNLQLNITLARIFTTASSYNNVCLVQEIIGIR